MTTYSTKRKAAMQARSKSWSSGVYRIGFFGQRMDERGYLIKEAA